MASKNNKINGGDLLLMAKRVGDTSYKPLLCQVNVSTTRAINTQDNSSKCGDDISPDKETSNIQMTGFMINGSITDVMNTSDIEGMVTSEDTIDFMIMPLTGLNNGGLPAYHFSGFFTNDQNQLDVNTKGKTTLTVTTEFIDMGIVAPNGQVYWNNVLKNMGYTPDWYLFTNSLGSLPYSYVQSAKTLLAPGLSQVGKIAGITDTGGIQEFTLSRNGVATYVDKNGLLQTAAANVPRIDYSLGDGVGRYLVEAAETNQINWSEDFTIGHWNQTRCIPTISTTKSSQGVLFNSIQRTDTTIASNLSSIAFQSTANSVVYARITLRAGSTNKCDIGIGSTPDPADGSGGSAWGNGSLVSVKGPGTVIPSTGKLIVTGLSTSVDTIVIIKRTYVSASISTALFIYPDTSSSTIVGASVLATAAHMSIGAIGSYIKTSGSIGIRIADQLQSVNDVLPYLQASIFGNFKYSVLGSGNTAILLMKNTNWSIMSSQVIGTASAYDGTGSSVVTGSNDKFISKYDNTNLKLVSAGILGNAVVYNHSNIPGSSPLFINYGGAGQARMAFSCIAIFDRAFTDTEAQTLTT